MSIFIYKAKSLNGETESGILESESLRELSQNLKKRGLILVDAEIKTENKKRILKWTIFSGKVSITEKIVMTRNLWIIIATGLPLVRGFSILASQARNRKMKYALLDISREIGQGKNLSDSLKKYPDIFSDLYINMVQSGEESGTMEEVLKVLSLQLKREKEMKSSVQKALIYPAVLVLTMVAVGLLILIFVFPKIKKLFQSLNADLPITTKIILGTGDFLMTYWYVLIIALFVAVFAFVFSIKTKTGRFLIDTISLKIPLVSSLVVKSNSAAFARSLSSLMASGVPLIKSLEITGGNVSNFYFKQALKESAKRVEKGEKLFSSLKPYQKFFSYGTIEMVEMGEETGKTSTILKTMADFYEEEVLNDAYTISTLIEPILIIVLGSVVGVFAISIIGPLYSVMGNI
jgi:type IV pilus assembly protein PilC